MALIGEVQATRETSVLLRSFHENRLEFNVLRGARSTDRARIARSPKPQIDGHCVARLAAQIDLDGTSPLAVARHQIGRTRLAQFIAFGNLERHGENPAPADREIVARFETHKLLGGLVKQNRVGTNARGDRTPRQRQPPARLAKAEGANRRLVATGWRNALQPRRLLGPDR